MRFSIYIDKDYRSITRGLLYMLQAYDVRLGGSSRVVEKADLPRGSWCTLSAQSGRLFLHLYSRVPLPTLPDIYMVPGNTDTNIPQLYSNIESIISA